jgi:hypothetical protein
MMRPKTTFLRILIMTSDSDDGEVVIALHSDHHDIVGIQVYTGHFSKCPSMILCTVALTVCVSALVV